MIVPNPLVKGGIAAVTSGYYGSVLEEDYHMIYVQSYCDGSKLRKLFKAIGSYFVFFFTLLTGHVDLVHIHSSFGPSFYRKKVFIDMAGWWHIPVVNHIHGADFEEFFVNADEKKKKAIKKNYDKCAQIIALSDEWKDKLSQIVDAEKITVIPNYSIVHEDIFSEKTDNGELVNILFLGELGTRKGVYDIPDIALALKEKCDGVNKSAGDTGIAPRFILAGAGSEEDEKAIKEKTETLGVSDMFFFPGWIRGEEKDELLRKADIFMLPSYNEGMPMSILDACGYGLPVISTNVGGIPKLVKDKENGFIYEPGDIAGMADGIFSLGMDEELRLQYGKRSLRLVMDEYSQGAHLGKIETVWKLILE